jgi:hypothetical protein
VNFEINSVLPSLLLVFVEKVLTCLFTPPLGNFHQRSRQKVCWCLFREPITQHEPAAVLSPQGRTVRD